MSHDVAVFIEPITHHFAEDRLFYPAAHYGTHHEPFAAVREAFKPHGIPVHTADRLRDGSVRADTNVYFSIGNARHYRRLAKREDVVLSSFFHFEAPIVHPSVYRETPRLARAFQRVYSFSTPQALAPFGCGGVRLESFRIPEPRGEVIEELWSRGERRFLTMISQNKRAMRSTNEIYTERLRAFEYFAETGELDLYGVGWDELPFKVGERRTPARLVRLYRAVRGRVPLLELYPGHRQAMTLYRGTVESKFEAMSRYTFALCYENMTLDGWINEKLFDAFVVGTIPIYLGAPDVQDHVPAHCFVDRRDFDDYRELCDYLRSLGPNEIRAYRENARDFLASDAFRPFAKETFADLFLRAVADDVGLELAPA